MHPNQDTSKRIENALQLWILEAKGLPQKRKYFCELCLDKTLYGRTSSKAKTDLCFWGELFEFSHLPETESVCVKLYREADRKKRKDRSALIGYVNISVKSLAGKQPFEKWYPVTGCERQSIKGSVPSIRIKGRYQTLNIFPLACYKDLLQVFEVDYLDVCSKLEPYLSAKSKEDIASSLIQVLHARGQSTKFLAELVMTEVGAVDNEHLMFRGNSVASKAMEAFMKLVGGSYLQDTLGDFVRSIVDADDDCEVDPAKIRSGDSTSSSHHSLASHQPPHLDRNRKTLVFYVEIAWGKILNSVHYFPFELRQVFSELRTRLVQRDRLDLVDNLLSSSLFLRFLCPAILSPNLFGLMTEYPSERASRTLTLVAKTLQTLANFNRFGGKEDYMGFMNTFVVREWDHMRALLEQISVPMSRSIVRTECLIDVGKQLCLLHSYLSEAISAQTEENRAKLSKISRILRQISTLSDTRSGDTPPPLAAADSDVSLVSSSPVTEHSFRTLSSSTSLAPTLPKDRPDAKAIDRLSSAGSPATVRSKTPNIYASVTSSEDFYHIGSSPVDRRNSLRPRRQHRASQPAHDLTTADDYVLYSALVQDSSVVQTAKTSRLPTTNGSWITSQELQPIDQRSGSVASSCHRSTTASSTLSSTCSSREGRQSAARVTAEGQSNQRTKQQVQNVRSNFSERQQSQNSDTRQLNPLQQHLQENKMEQQQEISKHELNISTISTGTLAIEHGLSPSQETADDATPTAIVELDEPVAKPKYIKLKSDLPVKNGHADRHQSAKAITGGGRIAKSGSHASLASSSGYHSMPLSSGGSTGSTNSSNTNSPVESSGDRSIGREIQKQDALPGNRVSGPMLAQDALLDGARQSQRRQKDTPSNGLLCSTDDSMLLSTTSDDTVTQHFVSATKSQKQLPRCTCSSQLQNELTSGAVANGSSQRCRSAADGLITAEGNDLTLTKKYRRQTTSGAQPLCFSNPLYSLQTIQPSLAHLRKSTSHHTFITDGSISPETEAHSAVGRCVVIGTPCPAGDVCSNPGCGDDDDDLTPCADLCNESTTGHPSSHRCCRATAEANASFMHKPRPSCNCIASQVASTSSGLSESLSMPGTSLPLDKHDVMGVANPPALNRYCSKSVGPSVGTRLRPFTRPSAPRTNPRYYHGWNGGVGLNTSATENAIEVGLKTQPYLKASKVPSTEGYPAIKNSSLCRSTKALPLGYFNSTDLIAAPGGASNSLNASFSCYTRRPSLLNTSYDLEPNTMGDTDHTKCDIPRSVRSSGRSMKQQPQIKPSATTSLIKEQYHQRQFSSGHPVVKGRGGKSPSIRRTLTDGEILLSRDFGSVAVGGRASACAVVHDSGTVDEFSETEIDGEGHDECILLANRKYLSELNSMKQQLEDTRTRLEAAERREKRWRQKYARSKPTEPDSARSIGSSQSDDDKPPVVPASETQLTSRDEVQDTVNNVEHSDYKCPVDSDGEVVIVNNSNNNNNNNNNNNFTKTIIPLESNRDYDAPAEETVTYYKPSPQQRKNVPKISAEISSQKSQHFNNQGAVDGVHSTYTSSDSSFAADYETPPDAVKTTSPMAEWSSAGDHADSESDSGAEVRSRVGIYSKDGSGHIHHLIEHEIAMSFSDMKSTDI